MTESVALTTIDNPYNPFERFSSWYKFDMEKGYNSCAYLGRIAKISDQLTQEENDAEIERAIDEIVRLDFMERYVKLRQGEGDRLRSTPTL